MSGVADVPYCLLTLFLLSSSLSYEAVLEETITMSKLIPGNQKHLTLDDRLYIASSLDQGKSFKEIARYLCKDPTTISKEIRLHRMTDTHHKGSFTNKNNFCVHRFRCRKTNVCEKIIICQGICRACPKCNQVCSRFEREHCGRLDKAPYVCNGCPKKVSRCSIPHKYTYDPYFAQRKYEEKLSASRSGVNLSRHQALEMDKVVTPLIQQGQSPYVILTNHPELNISVKTMYNYIDQGVLLTRNIDLKRKVKFKPRKHTKTGITDRKAFHGRTYADFKALDPEYFAEMDTVVSAKGSGKCILTFYIPEMELLIARLLQRCTSGAVRMAFDQMEEALGTFSFLSVFEVCLTDRGSEFGNPGSLETGIHDIQRTSIYYCDPMRSNQKGGIENVHTMLRMIIPKGTVFTDLTHWKVRKAADHINSTPRANLNGKTPYQLALAKFGPDVMKALKLKCIEPDAVTLTPELLKK